MSFLFSRYVVISVVFVSVAIFLQLDADFLTYFVGTLLPYEETSAYANQNVWITGASSGMYTCIIVSTYFKSTNCIYLIYTNIRYR